MGFIGIIIIIGLIVLMIASFWKLFEKAGKPGWAAIVPIYNTVVMIEIAKKPIWWIVLMLIPYVGVIWSIWVLNLFVKAFGKGEGYTVGIIFLPFIFLPMLAFSDDTEYIGGEEEDFFSDEEVETIAE
ncbi:MAG TPA: signal peptidase I [Bacteroidetes bacterium]|nr:signal peptidase I [Bacteroidota bacterium]